MHHQFCTRGCCVATYCPLVLSWATTIHKFQGFEAGFDKSDTINYIIATLNGLDWEKKNPGTAYVVASRAKTIGKRTKEIPYPINSNIFFEGQIGADQFTNCIWKDDNTKCKGVIKREAWVDFLQRKEIESRPNRSKSRMAIAKDFIDHHIHKSAIPNQVDLHKKIVDALKHCHNPR